MPYGKLGVLKTVGEKPIFALLDENDNPKTIIPDINTWLINSLGNMITLDISDARWNVTDNDKIKELEKK